jgi:hypothetical protein
MERAWNSDANLVAFLPCLDPLLELELLFKPGVALVHEGRPTATSFLYFLILSRILFAYALLDFEHAGWHSRLVHLGVGHSLVDNMLGASEMGVVHQHKLRLGLGGDTAVSVPTS